MQINMRSTGSAFVKVFRTGKKKLFAKIQINMDPTGGPDTAQICTSEKAFSREPLEDTHVIPHKNACRGCGHEPHNGICRYCGHV